MKLLKLEKYRCPACDRLSAFLQDTPHEAVNIEDHPEVAAKYMIMAAPVMILLDDNGNELDRVVGYAPADVQTRLIDRLQG